MSETPPPEPTPEAQSPPKTPATQATGPATQAAGDQPESTYSVDDLAAASASLGCHPWDVAGVFASQGATEMTMTDFQTALQQWQTTPVPTTEAGG